MSRFAPCLDRPLAAHSWCFLVAAGVRSTPGVLIVPLEAEFGWSRATISFAVAVNILLYGLVGPFAAAIIERFGLRRTVGSALALLSLGVALTPLMTRPWHLVLLWGRGGGAAAAGWWRWCWPARWRAGGSARGAAW